MDTNLLITEVDKTHLAANLALKNRDFDAYMGYFSDDLKYKQSNGKTIDKGQLSYDTKRYFYRIKSFDGMYTRLSSSFENDLFIEKLVQKATVTIRVFIFFSKKWTVEREGTYKWEKVDGDWKILDVEVTNEKTR
jgi:hypothetical protein